MSKTYKTDPYWVKMIRIDKNKPMTLREVHDHDKGPCDLPPEPTKGYHAWDDSNCYYDLNCNGKNTCCCNLCRGYYWKDERIKERQKGKAYTKRDYIKEYE